MNFGPCSLYRKEMSNEAKTHYHAHKLVWRPALLIRTTYKVWQTSKLCSTHCGRRASQIALGQVILGKSASRLSQTLFAQCLQSRYRSPNITLKEPVKSARWCNGNGRRVLMVVFAAVFFVFFLPFFLTKLKFLYKFILVLRVLGLGSRLQEVRPTILARGGSGGGRSPPA